LIPETELSFEKTEATAEDLLRLLDTLRMRAEHIPCKPQVRSSGQWSLLLAGFGFRPCEVVKTLFKHARLLVVRDDAKPTQRTLAARIMVIHAKRERMDRGEPRLETALKAKGVTFTVFMVPCQILCLVILIAAAGITANAFATPFKSKVPIIHGRRFKVSVSSGGESIAAKKVGKKRCPVNMQRL
jgi:hypothetical protein